MSGQITNSGDDFSVSGGKITDLADGVDPTDAANVSQIAGGAVASVFGRTGAVVAATNDYSEAQLSFTDIATNDASTTKHGYAPKLPNDATKFYNGVGGFTVPAGGGGGYIGYVLLQEQQAANTAAGGFTSGSFQTRLLNTEVTDTNGDCTLSANQFTLAAGTYEIWSVAWAYRVAQHKTRLRNVTDSSTVLVGVSGYSGPSAADGGQSPSMVVGRFTIAASKALELQHRCATTKTVDGMGVPSNFGEVEVYAIVELRRVS